MQKQNIDNKTGQKFNIKYSKFHGKKSQRKNSFWKKIINCLQ